MKRSYKELLAISTNVGKVSNLRILNAPKPNLDLIDDELLTQIAH